MQFRDTTKMAIKSALAIAIAELVRVLFHLDRGYWVTLTAMALTTQTWGDSVKRSLERVSMTILGGIFGTALYFILPQNQWVILSLLLVFTFFTVYLFQIFHLVAIFALTGFIVFLFAMLGDWELYLLRDRILDTAMGAGIALLVGCFFLPVKTDIGQLFVKQIEKIQAALVLSFLSKKKTNEDMTARKLHADFQFLRNNALAISYEFLFRRISRGDFYLLMTESTFCIQYVVVLINAYHWLVAYLSPEEKTQILLALNTTLKNLEILKQHLNKEPHSAMLQPDNLMDLLTKAIQKDPERFALLDTQVLGFFNLMYFFTRLNTRLNNIYLLLGKMNG